MGQIDVKCGAGVIADDLLLLPELSLGLLKLQPKNFVLTLKARGHLFGLADYHLQGARAVRSHSMKTRGLSFSARLLSLQQLLQVQTLFFLFNQAAVQGLDGIALFRV